MVILSHMRSLTSRPDSGEAMALATDAMSECSDKLKSSKPEEKEGRVVNCRGLRINERMIERKSELGQKKRVGSGSLKWRSKAAKQETSFITSHNSGEGKSGKTDVKDDSCANVITRERWMMETARGKRYFTIMAIIQDKNIDRLTKKLGKV